ncbi:MAG: acyl carrier protein [Proteobacteria bacterium]|nr:acyl carrier protein [Pseudomonadota bacterium]MBU1389278.1 acyl carrier protein [Pseudomonadota bacterium]MBU1544098.1 acyl carrier protein [Pseudomonadota bacterium]MBU2480633.1 acyl carrier protein [Pseudomonadota bacterium]
MTVETKVKKVIADKIQNIDIEDVVPEASLIEDLGADSLTIVELVMSMEEIFEIEIDDDDAEKLITVQDVIDFIKSKF